MLEGQDLDRRTRRHLDSKAEIVDAAWALAREEGIGGFTMRQLAARVGLKAPSLYQYFATKNDLYDAMFFDAYTQLRDRIPNHEGESPMSRDEIRADAREFFDFATEDPIRYALMCQRPVPGFEPSSESAALADEVLRTQVYAMMANVGVDEDEAVRLLLAIVNGIVGQQIVANPGGQEWRPLVDRAVDLFLDHVGVE